MNNENQKFFAKTAVFSTVFAASIATAQVETPSYIGSSLDSAFPEMNFSLEDIPQSEVYISQDILDTVKYKGFVAPEVNSPRNALQPKLYSENFFGFPIASTGKVEGGFVIPTASELRGLRQNVQYDKQ